MSLVERVFASGRAQDVAEAGLLGLSSRVGLGTNVFSRDWDLLVVLDTCRYDALRAMESEFDFVGDVDSIWSVGSSTREWAANTYTGRYREEIGETVVVCGNSKVTHSLRGRDAMESEFASRFTDWDVVSPRACEAFDSVPGYAPGDPYGGFHPPDIVTDRAVAAGREHDAERLLVHYVPPHNPYRAGPIRENRPIEDYEYRPFEYLKEGGDRERVWAAYLDELRWALEHVETLLENVDAPRTVITGDHGELFGHLGLYSHPTGVPHPGIRRVPWLETTATDTGDYEPRVDAPAARGIDADTREQLAGLGYR